MPQILHCAHCGAAFEAARRSARFCGGNCRVKAFNRRTKAATAPASLGQQLRAAGISGVHPLVGSKGSSSGPRIMQLIQSTGVATDRWVEPFLGSGAAYLEALKCGLASPESAVLNDLNGWALATIRSIRDQPDALGQLLALTPLSEADYGQMPEAGWDDLRIAHWWLTRCYQGFVGDFRKNRLAIDHGRNNSRVRRWLQLPDRLQLLAKAFVGPYLMQQDAIQFLKRVCTGTRRDLVFCDPPYVGRERIYAAGDWRQHEELAQLLATIPAALVAVTYDDCEEVQRLYQPDRWIRHEIERPLSTALARPGQPRERRTELLLIRRDS